MDPHCDSRNTSRDRLGPGAAKTTCTPRTRHGTKLRDMLMSDKPNLSYADFHHEITRNPDATLPKYVGSQQSPVPEKRDVKEEELVRYMSNLPSYLEKGKNYQEKALNVGVLDWKRLEKWRSSQKQVPHKFSGYSPSSSNTSLFSTDGSSTYSSRGQSCSPARQRMQRLSLQSPLEASPKEGHIQDAKSSSGRGHSFSPVRHITQSSVLQSHPQKVYPGGRMVQEIEVFGGNTQKFQDSTVTMGNHLSRQPKVLGAATLCERKGPDSKIVPEMGRKWNSDKYEVAATWKGKKKIEDGEATKETRGLRATKLNAADRDCSEREKSGSFTIPRDPLEHSCSGFTGSASFTVNDRLSVEPGEKCLLVRNKHEGQRPISNNVCNKQEPTVSSFQHGAGMKNSSHASRISLQSTAKILQNPSSIRPHGVKVSDEVPHVPSFPSRMFSSPTRNRPTPEKKPVAEFRRETATKPSEELNMRKSSESIPKARNPSPIRRLSFAMGKMIKNAGSRDNSPLRRSSSKDCIARSGPEAADSSLFTDNPCSDKLSTNNNRARSSPLRRLLDPILKPRSSNFSEPSHKHSSSVVGAMKLRNEPSDSRPGHSMEVNLRSASATRTSSSDHQNPKNGSSVLQALLQVSFKNGLPLFTFAIDNESNILAATVRKSSVPGKAHHSWIYTFFAIREVKRKSGSWLNHGGKGGNHGYVPNVVAQMKVSDSCSSSIKYETDNDLVSREFDLFAVDAGHGDEYSTDFHPTNELAAIIVKLPRSSAGNSSKDDSSSFDWLDLSQASLRENSQVTSLNIDSGDAKQNQHSLMSVNSSTTVVFPGGVHTVPSMGEISRLAQRWRSGGSCDCGGWDLGCQLRVYTNKKESETKLDSSGTFQNKNKLQLFPQVGQDNQPVLSLAPFKERIYSVEFSSALSVLQAFAVSVSSIDCRRPTELLEPSSVPEKVTSEVSVFEVPICSKMSKQAEVPGRYVSYPPHSPVGRV